MKGCAQRSVLDDTMTPVLDVVFRLPMDAVVETIITSKLDSFVKTFVVKTIGVGFASLTVMLIIYTMSLRRCSMYFV